MAHIIDGKTVAKKITDRVKEGVQQLYAEQGIIPCLHAIVVGDDSASHAYVEKKKKTCEQLGMRSEVHYLSAQTRAPALENLLDELSEDAEVHGILLQLPLPPDLERCKYGLIDRINPEKDVDGFTAHAIAQLSQGNGCLESCTPKGILYLLDHYALPTEGRHVVIVGRSDIVGKPLAVMMSSKQRNATVTLCHSKTKNLQDYTRQADILVAALGKPQHITEEMVKEGAVVIDVGVHKINLGNPERFQVVGDVDFASVAPKASYITPVPGGVGPMTVACLMENALYACKRQSSCIPE